MDSLFFQRKEKENLAPFQRPLSPPAPPLQTGNSFNVNSISPSIFLIIIILAVIFFVSGSLHLLFRFLYRPINIEPEDFDNVTVFHGQLQQLFHLHDSGVDQSQIDTLPVFLYKAIIGLKNPFDCAVCLCEFSADDQLRLIPKCSHAFHLHCIDTWLLSHSTCPLCRGSLLPDFPSNYCCSPVVIDLESESESSREFVSDRIATSSVLGSNVVEGMGTQVGFDGEDELGFSCNHNSPKSSEISVNEDDMEEEVVSVKLGKFRNVEIVHEGGGEGNSSTNSNVDARRCFSMGSFEYVLDESSSLQVAIIPSVRKLTSKKLSLPLMPSHRTAMSECDCHSNREGFKGFDTLTSMEIHGGDASVNAGNAIGRNKRESFSVSNIWLQSQKKKKTLSTEDSSRRAFSFRFPVQLKHSRVSRRTISEINASEWEKNVSELGVDEEVGRWDSQPNVPSFARRTLLWLVGKQRKVVHSSSSPNV